MPRVEHNSASLDVRIMGTEGRTIVMLPSLGRGRDDFNELAAACVAAGWQVILPEQSDFIARAVLNHFSAN